MQPPIFGRAAILAIIGLCTAGRIARADSSDEQYRNDDGGYTIAFADTPDESTMHKQVGDLTLTVHMEMVHNANPGMAYAVAYVNMGRDFSLDDIAPSMIRAMTGQLGAPDSTSQVNVDGEQGKEFIFHPESSFIRIRIFSHHHFLYTVLDVGPQSEEGAVEDLHFVNSFQFIDQQN